MTLINYIGIWVVAFCFSVIFIMCIEEPPRNLEMMPGNLMWSAILATGVVMCFVR